METEVHIERTCVLTLTEFEATWLKGIMQNPFTEDESQTDNTMREDLWKNLDAYGVKSV